MILTRPAPMRTIDPDLRFETADGATIIGRVYPTQHREYGRRIILERDGKPIFDTDDCYDHGNALSVASTWLESQPWNRRD